MSTTLVDRRALTIIQAVVFGAGFTFLIYEVSWNRQLALVLGTTVVAATIVLTSFMAGLGIGAHLWGRIGNERRGIGKLLAGLLAGIGLFGLLNHLITALAIPRIYSSCASGGVGTGLTELLVFALASLCVFLPAFLMGGVFPLANKIAVGAGGSSGEASGGSNGGSLGRSLGGSIGRLYALETLGSTIGGLATGFLFLGLLGQRNTILLAVVINLVLAVWLLVTDSRATAAAAADAATADDAATAADAPTADKRESADRRENEPGAGALRRTALLGTFVCGFAILALQIIWLRMFRVYLTNTSYTFALISSIAIMGLFVGSALFARRADAITDPARSLQRAILLMAGAAGLGLLLLVHLPETLMFPFQAVLGNPLARVLLLPLVVSLLVVFPPALCSGYAFPLACRMYTSSAGSISKDVGFVLMVNTAGSVIGPLVATMLLIPLLGVSLALLLVVTLLTASLLAMQMRPVPATPGASGATSSAPTRYLLLATVVALVVVIALRPTIRILPPSFSRFERDVLFYRESIEGNLVVGRDRGTTTESKYTYVNNSAVIGSTYDAVKAVKMIGHFPFFLGLECRDVLVIGFGIGVTTSAIASHPEVESIECVELVTGLREAAAYYRDLNHDVVDDPRLRINSGDGRHHLQRTAKNYDLISCDPTHPILGSGNLYTREYFNLCREHLNPGGMVSQYLPLHKLRTEDLLGIIGTFAAVFPHCTVWLGHYHAVLLGGTDPIRRDFGDWEAAVARVGPDAHTYLDPYHLAATLILDEEAIARLTAGGPINTDDRSYTEFFAPACLDADNIGKNLRFFMEQRSDISGVFSAVPDQALMARFIAGNRLLTESLYYKLSGDNQRSLQVLQQACQVNPEDREFPFLIRLYY